jgi:molybdopterin synthase catalytic subunit/molybdopterin converting factor small subunit
MMVRVLFFGPVREITGVAEERVSFSVGETAKTIFDRYAARFPQLSAMRDSIVVARNRELSSAAVLEDGDEIAFLPPVSGGTEEDIAEIIDTPIDARALAARLACGSDGAIVTFEGITRDNSNGRAVRYLEYEAYRDMALAQIRGIVSETRERWPIGRIGVIHRLGRVNVGEASVAIVVASPHRAAAFDACRFIIDRLKKTVPIWKKEFFEDGEMWVEGESLKF